MPRLPQPWSTRATLLALTALACSPSGGGGAPLPGDAASGDAGPVNWGPDWVYDPDQLLDLELAIPTATWEAMLADPLADTYQEAALRWGDERIERVGVRFKGNSSRWSVQRTGGARYSFKVKLDEFVPDQSFHGIKTLNLHNSFGDPSFMRERLTYDAFRDLGVPASRLAYVNLWVNGERWGLYTNVEQVNKTFLRQWFQNDTGNLYKPERGDLTYRGTSIDAYGGAAAYELETNEAAADYTGLLHFVDVLNNTDLAGLETALTEVLDVELFLRWLAANTLLVSLDSYAGSIPHNYYLYDNPATGRFVYIPWDSNESYGGFACGGLTPNERLRLDIAVPYCANAPASPGGATLERPLISRVLEVPAFATRYHELLADYVDARLSETTTDTGINHWQSLIDASVTADPTKFFTAEEFRQSLTDDVRGELGLRRFVAARNAYVRASLAGTLTSVCGDTACDPGETCTADCSTTPTCPPCFAFFAPAGRCVPSCNAGCSCPDDGPQPLVCNPTNSVCVPRCFDSSTCPPPAPICDVAIGLCHP